MQIDPSSTEQLTREQAIALHDSKVWETWTPRQRAEFQMRQECLCMPFDTFHESVETTLKRPVWTHEFGSSGRAQLLAELFQGADPIGLKTSVQALANEVGAEKIIFLKV